MRLALSRSSRRRSARGQSALDRPGKALGHRWEVVDLEQAKLFVRHQLRHDTGAFDATAKRHVGGSLVLFAPKTGSSRRAIDLPSIALDMMALERERRDWDRRVAREAWQETDHVFTTSIGTPFDPRKISRELATVAEYAGFGLWHFHELRNSVASLMLGGRIPTEVVPDVLGQCSIRIIADTYGHIENAQRLAVARALEAAVLRHKP